MYVYITQIGIYIIFLVYIKIFFCFSPGFQNVKLYNLTLYIHTQHTYRVTEKKNQLKHEHLQYGQYTISKMVVYFFFILCFCVCCVFCVSVYHNYMIAEVVFTFFTLKSGDV